MPQVKVLSLTQPWASLVAIGAKKIETRSWSTNYRGPLAIHAAKKFPGYAKDLLFKEPFVSHLLAAGLSILDLMGATVDKYEILSRGRIVAVCDLVDVVRITEANAPSEPERSFGDYTPGRWAWYLANVRQLPEPIPAKGSLGLWTVELSGETENATECSVPASGTGPVELASLEQ